MKINEIKTVSKSAPSLKDIAKKHEVHEIYLQSQLARGIKEEMKHNIDRNIAANIALTNLYKSPYYYDQS